MQLTTAPVERPPATRPAGHRADLIAVLSGVALLAVALVVGAVLEHAGRPILAPTPPLSAWWRPHVGLTTPIAAALAVGGVVYGPALARRLPWRTLLAAAWLASLTWIGSLALVDGWDRFGWRLTSPAEYLSEVPSAPAWSDLLPGFAGRIVGGQPDAWHTHVAGHPPGAFAFFILLDRIGLSGGAWAAAACVLIGSTAIVAVLVTLRAVDGSEETARRAVPFLVLAPPAIWMGVSADAVFLAVSAWAIALLAQACGRTVWRSDLVAAAAGVLFGASLFLSYGLALIGLVALAVLVARRRVRPGVVAAAVAAAMVGLVALGGFWWLDGYQQLSIRYHQGAGGERPYSYWVWADLAALVVCIGPVVLAGLRRTRPRGSGLLLLGAVAAILLATLSGFSKAEVERIWLPFAFWLLVACAWLPRTSYRTWLAVQAATVLLIQHLLLTNW